MFASQLAQRLAEKGHELALVFLFSGDDTLPTGKRFYLQTSPNPRSWHIKSWYRLARLIEEFKPDIVQANAGDTLKFAGLSRFFFRWKSPLVFRNANLISGFMDSSSKRLFYRFLLTQVSGVASVSRLCMEDFQALFAWKKPLSHLPIGTAQAYPVAVMPHDLAAWLGGDPFLIHIGSFVSEKNHEGLLRIFNKLTEKGHSDLKLVLCGDGPLRARMEEILSLKMISLGSRQDVNSILPFARALLLPSLIEGLPGVILEAMVSKVPVIAYDTGGISEVILNEKTGFLIAKGDERKFAAVLKEQVLAPGADLSNLLANAYRLVEDSYSIESVSDQFEKFYLQLVNGSTPHTDS